jgi:hypothetical protein
MRRRRVWLLGLLCLLAVCLLASGGVFFLHTCNKPRDDVKVTVRNAPDGTYFVCFVVGSQGRLHGMQLYEDAFFGPVKRSPTSVTYPNGINDGTVWQVAWEDGERYAVATRTIDGTWRITWVEDWVMLITGSSVLTAGPSVDFDLSKGKTEPLGDDAVNELNLRQVSERPK